MIHKKLAKILKQFYKHIIFNMSRTNNFIFIGFYKYLYHPPRESVSEFLHHYSKANKNIFVLQIGANDGFNHDPIHKFIKRNQWKGVLIEPQRYVHDTFLQKLHQHSKDIVTLNAALGDQDGVMPIFKIGFTNERWASGLTTFYRESLQERVDSGIITRQAIKQGITPPASLADYIVEEQVEVISPATIKNRYQIKHLNVLMIDTEGYDFEIIKLILNADLIPEVIIFEHSHLSDEELTQCQMFLKNNDYHFKMINANTIAVNKNSAAKQKYFM